LENLKAQLKANPARMVAELRVLANQLRRRPSLSEYLAETRYELADLYKGSIGGWHALLGEAQLLAPAPTQADHLWGERFHFLLHIDSPRRLRLNLSLLREVNRPLDDLPLLEKRMIEMLTFRLLPNEARQPECEWSAALQRLRMTGSARQELQELSEVLLDRVRLHAEETPALPDCPLFLHRQYMRNEVLVGLGMPDLVGARHTQTGRFWIEPINTEVFFVTLDKSEKTFSPSTRYEDFAVSRTRFHWQSQSTTGEDSQTGRRYVFQKQNGARFLLFVRPKRSDAFIFLGLLHYVSHTGSRPMSIYWDLEHPMPAWFFEVCASLRAA
jgi:hypothetical protein